ncbi:mitochondrial intermembrane space import and assembly protein 40-B-like [Sphaeramia orbicularis]|uniref:mitochondrial intermembrane space import and assembly protein 40-B-like n=1 Tax=Sphaeramia orbicularis TaxID=375764 RepID=UPI00117E8721|nr:mitochondrial intermembrane space import and assembly protein 40-B-like [Sphaeramia orbicularis]
MASGPCGTAFKDAFSCFHYSKEEVKGSECMDQFRSMQECMQRFPELYPQEDDKVQQEKSETHEASQSSETAEMSGTDSAPAEDSNTTQSNTETSEES